MIRAFFLYLFIFLNASSVFSQSLQGTWRGNLSFSGVSIPFVLHFEPQDTGWNVRADSPDQGAFNIPAKCIVHADSLKVDVQGGIQLLGKINSDTINGDFLQSGVKLPIRLIKQNEGPLKTGTRVRPQEPHAPYSYDTLNVRLENTYDKIVLGGTLTIPAGSGKFPAVLLISGSGPQNRDEEVFGHKPFKVLADYLTKQGIMVLRYDDRGVGESEGSFANSTIADFNKDAIAAFEFLKKHKQADVNRLGIIGHSEGGLIAQLLAGQGLPDLSFIVSLAGPAYALDRMMVSQLYEIGKASGMGLEALEKAKKINAANFAIAKSDLQTKEAYQALLKNMDGVLSEQEKMSIHPELMAMLSPAYRYFLRIEPEKYIPDIAVPVFAAFGEKDVQVPALKNMESLKHLLPPHEKTVIKSYQGLNHLFQKAATGLVAEYEQLEETFSEEVLKEIVAWINML